MAAGMVAASQPLVHLSRLRPLDRAQHPRLCSCSSSRVGRPCLSQSRCFDSGLSCGINSSQHREVALSSCQIEGVSLHRLDQD